MSRRSGVYNARRAYIRQHIDLIKKLPEPGEQWRSEAVPKALADRLLALKDRQIVHQVDRVYCQEWSRGRCVWETDADAYELLETTLEGDTNGILPCGHSAISNEPGVDGITCRICDRVHAREEVDV